MRKIEVPSSGRFENSLPLAAILDEFLATQRSYIGAWVGTNGAYDREPTFHMSGAVCLRKEVLQKEKAPETPQPGTSARRFAVGNIVEALMDKAMEATHMKLRHLPDLEGILAVNQQSSRCYQRKERSSGWTRTSNPPVNSRMLHH